MQKVKYELVFCKKGASLGKEPLRSFVLDVLNGFGGLSLLSNVLVHCLGGNRIEVCASKECVGMVHGALVMCGKYQDVNCCFRECTVPALSDAKDTDKRI